MASQKIKLAIYDLTDCEGCQVELIALKKRLLVLEKRVEVVAWRLAQERAEKTSLDLAVVEGTPIRPAEVKLLKQIRKRTKYLIALGSCATLGGIPAIIDKKERRKWYKKIYGEGYKPRGIDALPLAAYVPVDFLIHGCPIDREEFWRIIEEFLSQKKPLYRPYSVCFECKLANNPCRILEKKPCLGPITQGGCGAICLQGGSPCYGCFGLRKEANLKGLEKLLAKIASPEEAERYLSMFLSRVKKGK